MVSCWNEIFFEKRSFGKVEKAASSAFAKWLLVANCFEPFRKLGSFCVEITEHTERAHTVEGVEKLADGFL